MSNSPYVENFSSSEDVISSYSAPKDALDGAEVLLAWYGYGDYCGSSLVIFAKDGKLWEVNGSHCSCYGLEDQWQPEETTWEALSIRNLEGGCEGGAEAQKLLTRIVGQHITSEKPNA